jgi:hypothetical protein
LLMRHRFDLAVSSEITLAWAAGSGLDQAGPTSLT